MCYTHTLIWVINWFWFPSTFYGACSLVYVQNNNSWVPIIDNKSMLVTLKYFNRYHKQIGFSYQYTLLAISENMTNCIQPMYFNQSYLIDSNITSWSAMCISWRQKWQFPRCWTDVPSYDLTIVWNRLSAWIDNISWWMNSGEGRVHNRNILAEIENNKFIDV